MAFSVPRRSSTGAGVESAPPEQDPEFIAIKERARGVLDRLRAAMEAVGTGKPAGAQ